MNEYEDQAHQYLVKLNDREVSAAIIHCLAEWNELLNQVKLDVIMFRSIAQYFRNVGANVLADDLDGYAASAEHIAATVKGWPAHEHPSRNGTDGRDYRPSETGL